MALGVVEEEYAALTLAQRRKPVNEAVLDTYCYAVILHDPYWAILGGTQSKNIPFY